MGHVMMSKRVAYMRAPVSGIRAGSLAVGSVVNLMEGSTAVEYLVVHQGKPSDLYDDSCDGTWLLRKNIHSNQQWHTSDVNKYETSTINTWLNGDFFNSLGSVEQAAIKQVKIPYRSGGGYGGTDQSGVNGLSCKVFLLGGYELGWTTSDHSAFPVDGAKLNYFTASSGGNSKRIAYLNGIATSWWTRSQQTPYIDTVYRVGTDGSYSHNGPSIKRGIRPALVLPSTALFDKTTMILKGAA